MNPASWLKQINRKKTINGNTQKQWRCFTKSEPDVNTQLGHSVNKIAVAPARPYGNSCSELVYNFSLRQYFENTNILQQLNSTILGSAAEFLFSNVPPPGGKNPAELRL
jgi:hypothetical protein